jgi:uncharacterized repeat protein (TIGR01451 family)
MKTFTPKSALTIVTILIVAALAFPTASIAQFRNYNLVYSDNIKGGAAIFGNTLTHIVTDNVADTAKMNGNRADGNSTFGNDNSNIQTIDVDGNTGIGVGTKNSSAASLALPAGTNYIKLARLYWGGRVRRNEYNLAVDSLKRIKVSYNGGTYAEYAAYQLDKNTTGTGNSTVNQYQAYVDITDFVKSRGSGTYTVGNAPLSVGATGNGGNYGGWCIVVVYENFSLPSYNSVRVYDGFQQVFNGGAAQITSATLTGLNVPSGPMSLRDAKMGAMVWEGDANLTLDYLKINGINFQNSLNAINNPWNGTITDTGVHVTTKNPNYTNQMGIDIDQFYVGNGYGIQAGDTSVTLEFGTEADQYFPGLFTFQIKTNDPTVTIDKFVKDANNNHIAQVNEELTYTLKGKNSGIGDAHYVVITDSLPNTVTYVPGSMKVITCTGLTAGTILSDAVGDDQGDYIVANRTIICRVGIGATEKDGGLLRHNETFEIEFKVTVNNPGSNATVPPIINVARIVGYSDAGAKSTDDGTAILEPQGGPLPVTLISFLANLNNHLVDVQWSTSMEINSSKYFIERSVDAISFSTVATIAAAGNSLTIKKYAIQDDVSAIASSLVYYRILQVDVDGKKSYSKVISIRLKKANSNISVFPNPFKNYVNINLDWTNNETANIKVFTLTGVELINNSIQLYKGNNYVFVNQLMNLKAGTYFMVLNTSQGRIFKQIIKQ